MLTIVEGFYAIEQYAPDYTAELTRLVRRAYGRSHFQIRWGAEEEKHADLWRNVLLFSGARTPEWIESYTDELRANAWRPPWDNPIHMLLYTVIQERATELSYLNVARIARGECTKTWSAVDVDPVLAKIARTIAVDEAAHYNFFLDGARLYLYYYPEETLTALVEVLRSFMMPGSGLVPNYDGFVTVLYEADVFNRRKYARDVVMAALENLGIESVTAIEDGIRSSRRAPDQEGRMRDCSLKNGLDLSVVESALRRLFDRIGRHENAFGVSEIDPTRFVPNPSL
jgi:acyl-[acyl-carrier-protein] desaturase